MNCNLTYNISVVMIYLLYCNVSTVLQYYCNYEYRGCNKIQNQFTMMNRLFIFYIELLYNHFKIRLKFSYEIEDLRILTEYFNSIWWSYVYWYFKLKNKIVKVKYNKKRPCHVSTGQSQTHTHKLTNIYKYSHIHTITRTITSTHTRANTSTHK